MEALVYTHLVLANEEAAADSLALTWDELKLVQWLKQARLSNQARLGFLSLAIILTILSLAGDALAQSVLKRGARGSQVRRLQQELTQSGVYTGPVNGRFGPLTQRAVRRFQRENGLRVDGIVGRQTWSALNRINNQNIAGSFNRQPFVITNQPPVIGSNQAFATSNFNEFNRFLQRGDVGADVGALQQRLSNLGLYNSAIDRKYGSRTETAVRQFQFNFGLPVTGVADSRTLMALGLTNDGGFNPGIPINPFDTNPLTTDPNSTSLRVGNRGQRVRQLQETLSRRGYNPGRIDGIFGSRTRDALIAFQLSRGLRANGVADRQTLIALGVNNPDTGAPYVVVIPDNNGRILFEMQRRGYTNLRPEDSRLGSFINAGEFTNRGQAEELSTQLRNAGFDARVAFANNFR